VGECSGAREEGTCVKRGENRGRNTVVTKVEGRQEQGKEVERKQSREAGFKCEVPPPLPQTSCLLSIC